MSCHVSLRRPLRQIIKAIGTSTPVGWPAGKLQPHEHTPSLPLPLLTPGVGVGIGVRQQHVVAVGAGVTRREYERDFPPGLERGTTRLATETQYRVPRDLAPADSHGRDAFRDRDDRRDRILSSERGFRDQVGGQSGNAQIRSDTGSGASISPGTSAQDGRKTPVSVGCEVRRVEVDGAAARQANPEAINQAQVVRSDGRTTGAAPRTETPTFRFVSAQGEGDSQDLISPRIRDDGPAPVHVVASTSWHARHTKQVAQRGWRLQKERHPDGGVDWFELVRALDRATPASRRQFSKRSETLRLPDGIRGVWRGQPGELALEIMRRTGSHVQMLAEEASSDSKTFTALILYGRPQQNKDAIACILDLADAISIDVLTASKALKDYNLTTRITDRSGVVSADASAIADEAYWAEQNQVNDEEEDQLEPAAASADGQSKERTPLRAVWIRSNKPAAPVSRRLADMPTPPPQGWTALNLAAYVEDITRRVPRLIQRQSRDRDAGVSETSTDLVNAQLVTLFSTPALVPCITSETLNRAIKFLDLTRAHPSIRTIFSSLESDGRYTFTDSNHDALLQSTIRGANTDFFRHILRMMAAREMVPSWRSWTTLHALLCRRYPSTVPELLARMKRKGLLDEVEVVRHIAYNSVRNDFEAHLNMKAPIDGFLRLYDARYAADRSWVSGRTISVMAESLCARAQLQEALRLVAALHHPLHAKITTRTLNVLLRAAQKMRKPEAALDILRQLGVASTFPAHDRQGPVMDQESFTTLFILVWDQRWFNMARVVWRYACIYGHVSYDVQIKVRQSLISYVPAAGSLRERRAADTPGHSSIRVLSRHQLWYGWAGKFVIGTSQSLTIPFQRSNPVTGADSKLSDWEQHFLDQSHLPISSEDADPVSDSTQHVGRKHDLYRTQYEDMSEATSLAPRIPFTEMLQQAWRKDLIWRAKGIGLLARAEGETKSMAIRIAPQASRGDLRMMLKAHFAEMLKDGIHVPMEVGNATECA